MMFAIAVLSALLAFAGAAPATDSPVQRDAAAKLDDMRPLPDEKDSFETIRRNNKVYVDKTSVLQKLMESSGSRAYYFTRPRKFGKSTFLRMVQKYFLGEKELFEKLDIYERGNAQYRGEKRFRYLEKKEDKWIKYPVIYLDFSNTEFLTSTVKDFRQRLQDEIQYTLRTYNAQCTKLELNEVIPLLNRLLDLPVILLVDGFDAPVLHAFRSNNSDLAKGILAIIQEQIFLVDEMRSDGKITLTLVSGVSRFDFFMEEGGAKNYVDLTDDKEFATAIGFTAKEIDLKFDPHLRLFARSKNTTREEIMKELSQWYEGYRFSNREKTKMLNPVSAIKCLENHRFDNYWCATGPTPYVLETFVKDKLGVDYFDNYRIDRDSLFKRYTAEEGEPPFFCFMLYEGYLTITNYDRKSDLCVLDYPNKEIKEFLTDQLSAYVASENKSVSELAEWNKELAQAMRDQKIPATMECLKRYGFPILFSDRGHSPVWDWGVTLRLRVIFDAASIKYREGTRSAAEEGTKKRILSAIHMQTLGLPVNYVLETECEEGVQDAILRLISFVRDSPDAFKKEIDNQNEVYLVGISFTESGLGELGDWICLPYKHGELKFNELQASSQDLVDIGKKFEKT